MFANILIISVLAIWTAVAVSHVLKMTKQAVKTRSPACIGCSGCGAGSGRRCHHHLP